MGWPSAGPGKARWREGSAAPAPRASRAPALRRALRFCAHRVFRVRRRRDHPRDKPLRCSPARPGAASAGRSAVFPAPRGIPARRLERLPGARAHEDCRGSRASLYVTCASLAASAVASERCSAPWRWHLGQHRFWPDDGEGVHAPLAHANSRLRDRYGLWGGTWSG